jgi:hypothetical protein
MLSDWKIPNTTQGVCLVACLQEALGIVNSQAAILLGSLKAIFSQIDANNQFSPETLVEKANEIMDDDDAEVSVIKEMAEKCRGTFHVDRLAKEKFQHFLSFDYYYYFQCNIKV